MKSEALEGEEEKAVEKAVGNVLEQLMDGEVKKKKKKKKKRRRRRRRWRPVEL